MRPKRLLAAIAALVLILSLVLPAFAAELRETVSGVCGEDLFWELDTESGVLNVFGTGAMTDYDDLFNMAPWHEYRRLIRSLIVDQGAESIGECAFFECVALDSVILPESLTSVGAGAFKYCYSLTEIVLPDGITSVGGEAFRCCYALRSVSLPAELTEMGGDVFYYCTSLGSVAIPSDMTSIPGGTFYKCFALYEVSLPEWLDSIGGYAFFECDALTEITIPAGVASIGNQCFYRCYALNRITFMGEKPDSVGQYAFKSIRDDAVMFYLPQYASSWAPHGEESWQMTDIMPVGEEPERPVISDTYGNVVWTLDTDTGAFTVEGEGIMGEGAKKGNLPWKEYAEYVTSVTVGEGITETAKDFCRSCCALRSVSLPSSLTKLGTSAFNGCSAMTEIELPASLLSIGQTAFYSCTALCDVEIPAGVTEINDQTFVNCYSLKSIVIPDGVQTLYGIYRSGPFHNCYALRDVTLGKGVVGIGTYSFTGCENLHHIDLPEGLSIIENGAFMECFALESIVIPASVTLIGHNAFKNCPDLSSALFEGEPPEYFGNNVFDNAAADFKILYYEAYRRSWAPHGESTWRGYPIAMISTPMSELPGDANGDGTVGVDDALFALRSGMSLVSVGEELLPVLDVNGDGAVTLSDALAILRMAMGLA